MPGKGAAYLDKPDLFALSGSTLFHGVEIVELDALLRNTPYSVKSWDQGDVIIRSGSQYDGLRVVLEGSVNAEMESDSGRTLVIETIKAPDAIATGVLFSKTRKIPVSVTAGRKTRILTLPEETVLSLLQKNRTFLKNYLADIGTKLELFAEKFRLLQFSTLRQKLASWILKRSTERENAVLVTLPTTKERFADFLGVARPSLSRELLAMEALGAIKVSGREIGIIDMRKLESMVAEEI